MNAVHIIERSKDGGVTWWPMYGIQFYISEVRAMEKAAQMNAVTRHFHQRFRKDLYRATKYHPAEFFTLAK